MRCHCIRAKHNIAVGAIVPIKQCAATIDAGDGSSWRVGFGLLLHVLVL